MAGQDALRATYSQSLAETIEEHELRLREQEAAQGQLVQAQKLESIGQLAAGIAHEINTPIQFIGDNLRFLEDAFRDLMPLLAGGAAPVPAMARADPEYRVPGGEDAETAASQAARRLGVLDPEKFPKPSRSRWRGWEESPTSFAR